MVHAHPITLVAVLLTCAAAVARADTPKRIEVAPWCSRTADRLGFHLAFVNGVRRTVVNLTCDRKSGACSGARLELGDVECNNTLSYLALGAITGARIEQADSESSRIGWGAHVFTMNHSGGFVTLDGVRSDCAGITR